MKWSDNYNIDINIIDDQHKKLFQYIADYTNALKNKESEQGLKKLIHNLLNYTQVHFKNEEDYFLRFSYIDSENHKKQHGFFIEKINEIKTRLEQGKMVLPIEIGSFLRDWFYKHIQIEDKKYVGCFKENGIK